MTALREHPRLALATSLGVGGVLLLGSLFSFQLTRRAAPPAVGIESPALSMLSVALGSCRGVLAEILWLRIGDLQRQCRYAEIVPLTEILVTLEPSSEEGWAFNAWNLAYNVSSAHQEASERWRWVCRGVGLLKRGLAVNPRSVLLMRQMGWLFENKIGGDLDTAGSYYRAHLAELGVPEGGEELTRKLGAEPAWSEPMVHAVYWYWKAGQPYDLLRALATLLRHADPQPWIPLFLETARTALPEMSTQQLGHVRRLVSALSATFPDNADLRLFLKETAP